MPVRMRGGTDGNRGEDKREIEGAKSDRKDTKDERIEKSTWESRMTTAVKQEEKKKNHKELIFRRLTEAFS